VNRKAIIVGGGISGLSSALMLSRIGYEVALYEKSDDLRIGGAGITLWPNATYALWKMGLLDKLLPHCKIINDSSIVSSSWQVLSGIPFTRFAKRYGSPTIGVLRSELYRLLLSELNGIAIRTGHRCISMHQDAKQAVACFENGHADAGDLLIGADGIGSAVRGELFPQSKLRTSGITAWRGVASFEHEYCRMGYAFECWGRGLRFGFLPVSDCAVYWFATMTSGAADKMRKGAKEMLRHRFSGFPEPIPSVIEATDEEALIGSELADLKPIRSWVSGRAVLIGDAAHAATPNLGQGACMALEDAVVLGQCLHAEHDVSQGLKKYESLRRRRAAMVVRRSRWFGMLSQVEHPALYYLRNRLVRWTPPLLQQAYYREIIGYRV
jgi:2-polyprenyl-6-methoxyphenol hydroxylase-like FAD-dependent oxidoreductase